MKKYSYPTARDMGISEEKRRNVAILTVGVRDMHFGGGDPPIKFLMDYWARGAYGIELDGPRDVRPCGTAACFAGHGPLVGLPPLEPEDNGGRREMWAEYVGRLFPDTAAEYDAHIFLFSGDHCNDIQEALRRGAYYLQTGEADEAFVDICEMGAKINDYRVPADFEIDWPFIEAVAKGEA